MLAELTLTAEQLEDAAAYFGRPDMTQAQVLDQIRTQHVYASGNDAWWAWLDGNEEKGTGMGANEQEAVDDLLSRLT